MDSSIPIWVPIAIASGISIWALLSVLGSERQRRQLSQPMQIAPPSPPVNATSTAKAPAAKVEAKKPDRAAA
ncbi:MAG TPA: hypothetical protein VFW23_11075 [Tepidisphaeraceae bacterium]|nr:hypothetical protein [Tepidisphaeraceae bacterium]